MKKILWRTEKEKGKKLLASSCFLGIKHIMIFTFL